MPFTERREFAAVPEPTTGPSALVVSYLRTFVPVWWGAFVAWLLTRFSGLPDLLAWVGIDLESTATQGAITGAVIVLWYAVWRWLERKGIPDWVRRTFLGSAQAPSYGRHAAPPRITILPVDPPK